jgi:hypothetical protein
LAILNNPSVRVTQRGWTLALIWRDFSSGRMCAMPATLVRVRAMLEANCFDRLSTDDA